ncbi:MAG: alkaline phosphatase family protein [Nitrososphaeraceae archaeon]
MSANASSRKFIYVLLDGIGDLPHPAFGNMTPLEAARTPNLDFLAKKGSMGNVLSVGRGIAPQSDIAVFNMLGYSFHDGTYVGRGVIESIGSGIEFRNGDLALRGNFATVRDDLRIIDRRAGRNISERESREICLSLNQNVKFSDVNANVQVVPTIAHRVVIRFRHAKCALSENISNTDPAYSRINGIGIATPSADSESILLSKAQDNSEASTASAKLLNEFTIQVVKLLKDHPVNQARSSLGLKPINGILARDPGTKYPHLEFMNKKYGLNIGSIVDMPVEVGISKVLGMKMFRAGGVQDYETKALVAADKLSDLDGIYVHIKGPDEYGHDGDWQGKKRSIEVIDNSFFGPLLRKLDFQKTLFVISGDHSTPCIKNNHSDDPVPLLFSGDNMETDGSERFTESYAKKGSKGLMMGEQIIGQIIKILGR